MARSRSISADSAFVSLMLAGRKADAQAFARGALALTRNQRPCPCCGSTAEHEDNGSSYDLTFLCVDCGEQWTAEDHPVTVDEVIGLGA